MEKLISAQKYRSRIEKKAEGILKKLIPYNSADNFLNILIVGAGSFPSYLPLLNILTLKYPFLKTIHFTLVEPLKTETEFFIKNFAPLNNSEFHIEFSIYHGKLKEFLKEQSQKKFDMVYFEHPETMTLPIFLAKLGVKRFKRMTAFREAIPFLGNILKENTIILASCMSTHELKQLNTLLNFSFQIATEKVYSKKFLHRFYGGPYSAGLSAETIQPLDCSISQKNISRAIKQSDRYLFVTLFVSFFVYLFYCSQYPDPEFALQRLLAILLMGAQLYLHRPGSQGYLIKLTLLILQIAL